MANPKRKTSKSRRDQRRAHDALRRPGTSICDSCGEPKLPHRVCPSCGSYRGRDVIEVKESF
ncbi:MAG: 50S ribosomal protein L32 [Acidobacteriota bacterium]